MKKLLLTLLAVMMTVAVNAERVSKQEALMKAQQFMPNKQFGETKAFARSGGITEAEPFYIFNVDNNGGFVIVSGDDRTEAILGYSDKGHIDVSNMPDNLRYWLESYAKQINGLSEDYQSVAKSRTRGVKAAIPPLIQTQWDQEAPYNLMCPVYSDICYTGCTATAIAQVMYYFKWPKGETKSIPEYTTKTNKIVLPELPPTTFKWDKMKTSYSGEEDKESQNAVAELMRYVGQAMSMDYDTPDGSGASPIPALMKSYFGYSRKFKSVSKDNYDYSEWVEILYGALADKKPVLYGGNPIDPQEPGHEFLVDGYDGAGLFHINWGWGGWCDGFFALEAADPYASGIEGKSSTSGFSSHQTAVLYLMPPVDEGEATVGELFYWTTPSSKSATVQRASNYKELTELVIPASITIDGEKYDVKGVENFAFINASRLTSVKFSDGIESIGEMSFPIETLAKIELPASLKMIGKDAFSDVPSLVVYSYVENPVEIDIAEGAFNSNSILVIPDGCEDKYASLDCWKRVGKILSTSDYEKLEAKEEEFENSPIINFEDPKIKEIIFSKYPEWDVTEDGEISEAEAELVTDLGIEFHYSEITSFDELRFFTGLTTLPEGAFEGCASLASIVLPDNITAIGNRAFLWCSSLVSIKLPSHLLTIGDNAFEECVNLESVTLPSGLKTISNSTFSGCCSLTSLTIPEHVTSIDHTAFHKCDKLLYIKMESKKPCSLSEYFWNSCPIRYDVSLIVPNGCREIYASADHWKEFNMIVEKSDFDMIGSSPIISFADPKTKQRCIKYEGYNCDVWSWDINGDGEFSIAEAALVKDLGSFFRGSDITSFDELHFFTGLKAISDAAFNECKHLVSVVLPDKLETIGSNAFSRCSQLESISIPSKVNSIGNDAFSGCSSLTSVTMQSYPSSMGYGIFPDNNIKNVTFDCAKAFPIFRDMPTIEKVILTDKVSTIEDNTFMGCNGLVSIVLPNSLKSIGVSAFDGCHSLAYLNLPSSLTNIGDFAFSSCSSLTYLYLPQSVKFVGAFIIADSGVTSLIISGYLSSLGEGAFESSGIRTLTVGTSNPFPIDEITFSCESECILYVPFGSKERYENTEFWGDFKEIREGYSNGGYTVSPKSVNTVMLIEIEDAENYVEIPSTVSVNGEDYAVTAIAGNVFNGRTDLTSVSIPGTIEEIGDGAFAGCSGLKAIYCYAEDPIALGSESAKVRTRADGEDISASTVFAEVDKETCILYVPKNSGDKYRAAEGWREFQNIVEMESDLQGDANNDGKLDNKDVDAVVDYMMKADMNGFIFKNADMNGDKKINAADIVLLVNMIK